MPCPFTDRCACTKVFEEALKAVKFLGWLKKFGPAKNILRPVKGQGIRQSEFGLFWSQTQYNHLFFQFLSVSDHFIKQNTPERKMIRL